MKLISKFFISLTIWQLISSGKPAGHESGHHDHSDLFTSIGRRKQLEKCELRTGFLLNLEAWCGACKDPDMLDDARKWSECTFKRAPHVAQAVSENRKKSLHLCKAEVLEFATNLELNDPPGYNTLKYCFKHVKQENLAKCSIQQFYNPGITVSCGESKDQEVNNELKVFADCLSKKAPESANELARIKQDAPDVNTCVKNQKVYGLKVLMSDEKAFVKIQECLKSMTLEPLHKYYVQERLGQVIKAFCDRCSDPTVKKEILKSILCTKKKVPDLVHFFYSARDNSTGGPDTCYKLIVEHLTKVSLSAPDAFEIGLDCDTAYVDRALMTSKCC